MSNLQSYLNRTKGAGYRAGRAPKPIITRPNGAKILAFPDCPFTKRSQVLARYLWWEGYHEGMRQSLIESSKRWRAA